MAVKMCIRCHLSQKRKGQHKCDECWLREAPPPVRERAADERLAMIPMELRLARVPPTDWPPGRRWCASCQSFPRLQDCIGSKCSTCAGRAGHSDMLTRTYTIHGRPFTEDDYNFLFEKQGGCCWICERPAKTKRLAVEHDHATGNVRGLACPGQYGCNFAVLGNIRDLRMARRVVEYLEDPPALRWIKK